MIAACYRRSVAQQKISDVSFFAAEENHGQSEEALRRPPATDFPARGLPRALCQEGPPQGLLSLGLWLSLKINMDSVQFDWYRIVNISIFFAMKNLFWT